MSLGDTATTDTQPLIALPSGVVGYLAVLAAVVTGVIHLLLVPRVVLFTQTLATLFALNGLGFLGGIGLYLTRYWRRPLYLVAAGYATVTVLAFFGWGGWEGLSAFYFEGQLNPLAVVAKTAEIVVIGCSLYLYSTPRRNYNS